MNIQTVLLVDDDPNILKLAKMSLERVGGWQVAVAASGRQALQALGDGSALPDLIILDLMMPELDGLATLQELKHSDRLKSIPVVLMTAKVQTQQIEEYKELGAAGIIIKPFDPLRLPEEILALLK
ncbi:MAG TPA: response regulator [Candidatus Obscuribacterales bacterium]